MGQLSNTVKQVTLSGLGTKGGSFLQKGTFSRNGTALFDLAFHNSIQGLVAESDTSSGSITDYDFSLELQGTSIPLHVSQEPYLIREERPLAVLVEPVSSYVNERGKEYDVWGGNAMGAKVSVDGELYAAIDYYHNPAQIRLNRDFSRTLSQEQEDYLMALMLAAYHFETFFRDTTQQEAATTFSVN